MEEPRDAAAVAAWIEAAQRDHDRFEHVRRASHDHRERHGVGCSVYPTSSGPLLGVLASAVEANRILELGCGLGYSALWLAYGSGGRVETIEHDAEHATLAEATIAAEGFGDRIEVRRGWGAEVLPTLAAGYDLIFSDSDPQEMPFALEQFFRLMRPGGLLVSANLFLAQFVPDLRSVERMAEYRQRLLTDARLLTALLPGGLAVSVASRASR